MKEEAKDLDAVAESAYRVVGTLLEMLDVMRLQSMLLVLSQSSAGGEVTVNLVDSECRVKSNFSDCVPLIRPCQNGSFPLFFTSF